MKKTRACFLLLALIPLISCSQPSAVCKFGSAEGLATDWKLFREASLRKDTKEVEKYYHFPVKLVDMTDENHILMKISEGVFKKNYEVIFVTNAPNQFTSVHEELLRTDASSYKNGPTLPIDANGCLTRDIVSRTIGNYIFKLANNGRWQVNSVFYSNDDLFNLRGELK